MADLRMRLAEGPKLVFVSRIDFAVGTVGERPQLTLMPRTVEPLTGMMRSVQPYQIPAPMILNSLAVYAAAVRYVEAGTLEMFASESMTLIALGLENAPAFGISLDVESAVTTFPQVRKPTNEAALRRQRHKMAGNWVMALLAVPDVLPSDTSPYLQLVHVPDLPATDLDDDTLERAVQLSMGWNYLQLSGKDFMDAAREELRGSLDTARVLLHH